VSTKKGFGRWLPFGRLRREGFDVAGESLSSPPPLLVRHRH